MRLWVVLVTWMTAATGCGGRVVVDHETEEEPPTTSIVTVSVTSEGGGGAGGITTSSTTTSLGGGGEGGATGGAGGEGGGCGSPDDCDDGNPCTEDYCLDSGACSNPEDTLHIVCGDDAAGNCWKGACCAGCFDLSAGACVDACPEGQACSSLGACL